MNRRHGHACGFAERRRRAEHAHCFVGFAQRARHHTEPLQGLGHPSLFANLIVENKGVGEKLDRPLVVGEGVRNPP